MSRISIQLTHKYIFSNETKNPLLDPPHVTFNPTNLHFPHNRIYFHLGTDNNRNLVNRSNNRSDGDIADVKHCEDNHDRQKQCHSGQICGLAVYVWFTHKYLLAVVPCGYNARPGLLLYVKLSCLPVHLRNKDL